LESIGSVLRQDVEIYSGTKSYEGMPTYVLHDKWKNKFVNIGWLEFEILSRWGLKDAKKIASSICNETTLYADEKDVEALAVYLEKHELLVNYKSSEVTANLIDSRKKFDEQKLKQRVKLNPMAYLAFKVPLIKPNNFLNATLWMAKPFMSINAFYIYLALLVFTIPLVLQQWHSFTSYFSGLFSLNGAVYLFFALAISKTLHEFGHAYACKRFGLSVPTMGIMWMFIFGFLYTDTTESWKLGSRTKRVAIGSAGVLAELQLAVIATFLWSIMPDGIMRATCFYLATAAWIATLLINLSPFMRWDGYWVLSDLMGIQNLRERSNKLCKWFFGWLVMGFNDEVPVKLPKSQIKFSIIFAILSWVYRIGIFVGIGLLIFDRVFKLLGIFLLVTMVGRMVLWPIIEAMIDWFKRRSDMNWNKYSISSFGVIFFIILLLLIPWRSNIDISGVVAPKYHIEVVPGVEGQVVYIPKYGEFVSKNQKLFELNNPELEAEVEAEQALVNYYELALQRTGNKGLLESRAIDQERLATAKERHLRAVKQLQKLEGYAPYDGRVIGVNKNIKERGWLNQNSPVLTFADTSQLEIYAFIGEYELQLIKTHGVAKFYPENPSFSRILGRVENIDSANVTTLPYEILASNNGGPIPVVTDQETGRLKPERSVYIVRISMDENVDIPIMLRGRVILKGERKSFIGRFVDAFVGTVIRESGF